MFMYFTKNLETVQHDGTQEFVMFAELQESRDIKTLWNTSQKRSKIPHNWTCYCNTNGLQNDKPLFGTIGNEYPSILNGLRFTKKK